MCWPTAHGQAAAASADAASASAARLRARDWRDGFIDSPFLENGGGDAAEQPGATADAGARAAPEPELGEVYLLLYQSYVID